MARTPALPSWPRRWLRRMVLGCTMAGACLAQAAPRDQLEAAIVYNILPYVEWPQDAGPATGGPMVLCVEPASRLATPLRSLAGKPVRQHRLEVLELGPGETPRRCHAVFLDAMQRPHNQALRRHLRGQSVLVFGDEPPGSDAGVAVYLVESDGRIGFEVDMGTVREARLQINSRLLRLARRVKE